MSEDRALGGLALGLRILLGVVGVMFVGAGATAVFVTENGAGSAALLAFGGALLVLAALGHRVETLELGGARLKLRAAAAEKYARAEESERHGDVVGADRLRSEARGLMEAADGAAGSRGDGRA